MPWSMLLNPRLLIALAVAAAVAGSGIAGYAKGRSSERMKNELERNRVVIEAQAKAAEVEHAKNIEIQGISNDYEQKLLALSDRAALAERDLGRLRVRSCRDRLPTAAPASGKPHATATDGAVGPGSGEIDLDRAAGEIIRLGRDLDAANLRILELQALVRSYSTQ